MDDDVEIPLFMVKSPVAGMSVFVAIFHPPPTPSKMTEPRLEEPGRNVFCGAVANIRTVPFELANEPLFANEFPIASVPDGNVTVPAVMVRSFVDVAFVSDIVHVPPEPLKSRL